MDTGQKLCVPRSSLTRLMPPPRTTLRATWDPLGMPRGPPSPYTTHSHLFGEVCLSLIIKWQSIYNTIISFKASPPSPTPPPHQTWSGFSKVLLLSQKKKKKKEILTLTLKEAEEEWAGRKTDPHVLCTVDGRCYKML